MTKLQKEEKLENLYLKKIRMLECSRTTLKSLMWTQEHDTNSYNFDVRTKENDKKFSKGYDLVKSVIEDEIEKINKEIKKLENTGVKVFANNILLDVLENYKESIKPSDFSEYLLKQYGVCKFFKLDLLSQADIES